MHSDASGYGQEWGASNELEIKKALQNKAQFNPMHFDASGSGNSPTRTRDEPLNSGARCLALQALTSIKSQSNPALEGPEIGPEAGEVKNRAELARRLSVSRARITQMLKPI